MRLTFDCIFRQRVLLPIQRIIACSSIPFYDILSLDDNETVIIVMPLLRSYTDPPFDTFGEVVECFRQLFDQQKPTFSLHNLASIDRDCASCANTVLLIGAPKQRVL